jgi:hypothetical protein
MKYFFGIFNRIIPYPRLLFHHLLQSHVCIITIYIFLFLMKKFSLCLLTSTLNLSQTNYWARFIGGSLLFCNYIYTIFLYLRIWKIYLIDFVYIKSNLIFGISKQTITKNVLFKNPKPSYLF